MQKLDTKQKMSHVIVDYELRSIAKCHLQKLDDELRSIAKTQLQKLNCKNSTMNYDRLKKLDDELRSIAKTRLQKLDDEL